MIRVMGLSGIKQPATLNRVPSAVRPSVRYGLHQTGLGTSTPPLPSPLFAIVGRMLAAVTQPKALPQAEPEKSNDTKKPPLSLVLPQRKLMSYNTECFFRKRNGEMMKSKEEIQALADAIEAESPDVIALQEVGDRLLLQDFNKNYLKGQYPNIASIPVPKSGQMQVAILSKPNIRLVSQKSHWKEVCKESEGHGKRDFLEANFETETGYRFTVYNAHCKSMRGDEIGTAPTRMQEMKAATKILADKLKEEPKGNVLVAGDFNTLHDTPHGKPVIEALTHLNKPDGPELLKEVMLKDGKADPTHRGNERHPDSKLDYIFVSKPLWKKIKQAYVAGSFHLKPWNIASDHLPFVTVFEESKPVQQPKRKLSASEKLAVLDDRKQQRRRINRLA